MNFIETVFGVNPDNNSGSLEMAFAVAIVLALTLALRLIKAKRVSDAGRVDAARD